MYALPLMERLPVAQKAGAQLQLDVCRGGWEAGPGGRFCDMYRFFIRLSCTVSIAFSMWSLKIFLFY
jgi:hypothetical protein